MGVAETPLPVPGVIHLKIQGAPLIEPVVPCTGAAQALQSTSSIRRSLLQIGDGYIPYSPLGCQASKPLLKPAENLPAAAASRAARAHLVLPEPRFRSLEQVLTAGLRLEVLEQHKKSGACEKTSRS